MEDDRSAAYIAAFEDAQRRQLPVWCRSTDCQKKYLGYLRYDDCKKCDHCDKRRLTKKRWRSV